MGEPIQLLLQYRGDGFRLGHELRAPGASGPMQACHEHEVELCFIEQGGEMGRIGGRLERLTTGRCGLIAPGVEHSSWTERYAARECIIHFTVPYLERLADELGRRRPLALTSGDMRTPPEMERLVEALKAELRVERAGRALVVSHLMTTLAIAVLRLAPDFRVPPSIEQGSAAGLARAEDLIRADPGTTRTLDELAVVAGMSRFHFLRSFKRRYGVPPHQYLLRLRVERARDLIRDSDLSLTQIAVDLGFSSSSRLTEAFRGRFGQAPSYWRQRATAGR
jgi:AraC family transcriptional regulator